MAAVAQDFGDHLRGCLAEVERCAAFEVRRLGERLEALEAENAELRKQVGGGALPAERPAHCSNSAVDLQPSAPAQPSPLDSHTSMTSFLSVPSCQAGSLRAGVPEHILHKKTTRSRLYKTTGRAQAVARSAAFEYATLVLIGLNALWLAVDLDLNGKALTKSPVPFQVVEHAFVLLFGLDIAVRFCAFEHTRMILRDRWFLFDAVLMLAMVVDSWLLTIVILATNSEGLGGLGSVSVLRILRFLRLARVARMCAVVPELKTMVTALIAGVRTVLTTSVLLFVTTYGFAIALRQLGEATPWGAQSFSSVPQAIYTLLVESLLPDNGELLALMGQQHWYCALIFFVFLIIVTFLLLNMLLGVLCDVIFQVSNDAKRQQGIDSMSCQLEKILRSIDKDYDGLVSKAEFMSILDNREAVAMLADVGVDVTALVGEADLIFNMQDRVQLPFEDFRDEVISFCRTNQVSMGTITAFRRFLHMGLEQIAERVARVEMLLCKAQGSEMMAYDSLAAKAALCPIFVKAIEWAVLP